MGGIHFDTTQLRELSVDFSKAPGRVQRNAPKAMRRGAQIVKLAMKEDASGHRYLPKFASRVDFDKRDAIGLVYEIGFNKVGQGNLAHIIVFGSVNNAPVYDFFAALRRSVPTIMEDMANAGESSVFGGPR